MAETKGVLLLNMGSPHAAEENALRVYLEEFLMDERVLDYPRPIRSLIVKQIILPKQPATSAEAYASIWWPEGDPLTVISQRTQQALQARTPLPVELGMRYGKPSARQALEALLQAGVREIFAIPLYPHYAMSTFESAVVKAQEELAELEPTARIIVQPPYYVEPAYLQALYASARPYLQDFEHLLFSYHGLPERHLRKTDPTGAHCLRSADCCAVPSVAHATCYRHQVLRTTDAMVREFTIPAEKYSLAYQSRFGAGKWLQPATEAKLVELAQQGVRKLSVICPAFLDDCVETLEEIGIRGQAVFLEAGGEAFELIPCINDHPTWISTLAGWVEDFAARELAPSSTDVQLIQSL